MSVDPAIVGVAVTGMAVGALLIPLTRRELAAAIVRSDAGSTNAPPRVMTWQRIALTGASGLLPGAVLLRLGWSIVAIPPLLLLLGLIQLGFCDLTRRLLPRTMVYATTAVVSMSALAVSAAASDWPRLRQAVLGGAALFALLFVFNLINPSWVAFGDVRLAPAVGLGLAWISPMALVEGFFLANLLTAVVGIILIVAHRANRHTGYPFGLYLAVATAATILFWS